MTVISAMKFNKKEGAIVADEQSSNTGTLRKQDLATKVHVLESKEQGVLGIMGGSGASDVLYDTYLTVQECLAVNQGKIKSKNELTTVIGKMMSNVKRKYINGYLQNLFGLSETEFLMGYKINPDETKTPIHESWMQRYSRIISGSSEEQLTGFLNNVFLILASDAQGVELYYASMALANAYPISRPYEAIGSGSDMADSELYSFFESLPREERDHIPPVKGIAALLTATDKASTRNIGVGGTPFIYIVKDGKILPSPHENNTRLAVEIVRGTRKGYLSPDFELSALNTLVYEGGDFKSVEKEMWKESKNPDQLSLLLRSYKV